MNTHRRYFLLAVCLLSLPSAHVAAASLTIYVAPKGNDQADGSAAHPLRTLHGAQLRVRKLLAKVGDQSVRVEIAPGDYILESPLVFTPQDSGPSAAHPITYAASQPGKVRISGGRIITDWRVEDGQWVAQTPLAVSSLATAPRGESIRPFRDLWVNGRRAIRARSPNQGFWRIEKAGLDNRTSFSVSADDLLLLAKPQAAEVVFLHDWSISRVRMASIDTHQRTYRLADPIGAGMAQFAISHYEPHPRYFVENARELLDAPGEWLLDDATGELRYLPREGETLETTEIVAPVLEQLLILRGRDQQHRVSHLRFEGLAFCHGRFDIPRHGYAGIQATFHQGRQTSGPDSTAFPTAAVTLDDAQNCRWSQCRFEHLGGTGLQVRHSQNVLVEHCHFRDVGGNGVILGTTTSDPHRSGSDNTIENCLIENCGQTFYGAVGVWIGFASRTNIRHNEIRQLPYSGVSVGWQWNDLPTACRENHVSFNHIHHVMQLLSDGGGIYTLGRQPGTELVGNVIHDIPPNAGRAESNGIFMDQGSTAIEVSDNTIYNVACSPIRFNQPGKNTVVGNRFVARIGVPVFRIFSFNNTDPLAITMQENEQITAESWQPAAADPQVQRAGPQP